MTSDLELERIINDAFALYMPQIRSEIIQLAEFVRNHRGSTLKEAPYNILEIGTKYGGTFYIWNKLNPGPGINISIDMNDGGQHGGISELDMDKRDLWFQERFDNAYFIRGDSHNEHIQFHCRYRLHRNRENQNNGVWDRSVFDERDIDFLFIDGDHTLKGVKRDYDMYSPFVRPGGIIVFHDIVISDHHHSRNVHVGEFWNEIKHKYTHLEFVEPGNNWGGIGILLV
jgi:cephalosporin hydroxylase